MLVEGRAARRARVRQAQARTRAVIRRAVRALRRRYPHVTQAQVATRCGVDRSMVAKVWAGEATSNRVLVATIQAFAEAGWAPPVEPAWARAAIGSLPPAEGRAFVAWTVGAATPGAKESR